MRVILKKTMIIVGVAFVALLIWGYVRDSTKVKLYEVLDGNKITSLRIHTPFSDFETIDKSEILEIENDLKNLTFYKNTSLMPANNTPDAWMVLGDKNGVIVDEFVVYGNFAMHSKDENKYEFDYTSLDDLCKKYKK